MSDPRAALERATQHFRPEPGIVERVYERRLRRRRNQRIAAAVVAFAVVVVVTMSVSALSGLVPAQQTPLSSQPPPMHNGAIDVFGLTDGVRTYGVDGRGGFVVKCRSCTQVEAASWAPDGSRLAFSASCGGGCASAGDPYHGVRIVDPSAGTDRLILPGDGIGPLAWSPDGAHIAYATNGRTGPDGWIWEKTWSIRVMDVDGSHQADVLSGLTGSEFPQSLSWSPDGSRLVYSGGGRVIIIGLDGSMIATLARGDRAAWSPDGSTIAYLSGCEVRAITPEGDDDRSLADLVDVSPAAEACGGVSDLVWSPDGTELAALVYRGPADPEEPSHKGLFVIHADGSKARLLSDREGFVHGLGGVFGLTWQPIP